MHLMNSLFIRLLRASSSLLSAMVDALAKASFDGAALASALAAAWTCTPSNRARRSNPNPRSIRDRSMPRPAS